MKAYKGFNKDLTCRGFQFEIGKEYEEDSAKLYNKGFHACEYPLDCFSHYPPNKSRYCEVELEDNGERESGSTKVCGEKIKIGAEIGIKGLIEAAFEYIKEHCANSEIGADNSALTGGDWSALTGGNCSALTGGYRSALTGGDCSVVYGGKDAKVRGGLHSVLAIQYWVDYEFKGIKFAEVDGEIIKANVFYKLNEKGEFIEDDSTTSKTDK